MRVVIVPELGDLHVPVERGLDDAALDAAAASVYETDFAQAGRRGGVDVFGDNRGNVARREGVEIELAFNGNAHGLFAHVQPGSSALRAVLRLDDGLDAPAD